MRCLEVAGAALIALILGSCRTATDHYDAHFARWAKKERALIKMGIAGTNQELDKLLLDLKAHVLETNKAFATPEPSSPCLEMDPMKRLPELRNNDQLRAFGLTRKRIADWVNKARPDPWGQEWRVYLYRLGSPSCRKLFPKHRFLRVLTYSDHLTLNHTIAKTAGKDPEFCLDRDGKAVQEMIARSGFKPRSADDARHIFLAFAEISGLVLVRDFTPIGELHPLKTDRTWRIEVLLRAKEVDWRTYWKTLPEGKGWRVSCVFCTHERNWSCSRYDIEIRKDGRLVVLKKESVFFAFGIR